MNKVIKLFLAIIICEAVGILGAIFTTPAIATWYQALNKPSFSPPNYVFGPIWTTLYALMGVSIFLILEKKIKGKEKNNLIFLFSLQLLLNFLWSVIFFGFHFPLLAFLDIVFLWVSILFLIIKFWKVSKPASYLLMPYLLWVSIASVLNAAIVVLNR
jgi:translocator protein